MAELLILKMQAEQDAACEEFQYLLSMCVLEAGYAYDRVELLVFDGVASPDLPAGSADVLVIGDANVFLGRRSLGVMRRRLEEGRTTVWPYCLSTSDVAQSTPLYTLRGYETAEESFLSASPRNARPAVSHLPVSLFSSALAGSLLDRHGITALLTDPTLLSVDDLGDCVAFEGLYHEFADYYGQVRSDALSFLPPGVAEILEIGCGGGATGEYLQQRLCCNVTGVELNPVVARQARDRLHRVLVGDAMQLDLQGPYDAVLAFELFEHVAHGEAFLGRIRQVLKPGGRIVLSVPNVGHHSIVTDLLAGRWDYVPIGLLCYTHLRFFTRKTLEDWLGRSGFDSFQIVAQTTELPEEWETPPPGLPCDQESLRTKGFYVLIDV